MEAPKPSLSLEAVSRIVSKNVAYKIKYYDDSVNLFAR